MERTRLVLGAMTGTSIDGIDLAVAKITGTGLALRAQLVAFRSAQLGPLAPRLRQAADQKPMSAEGFAALAADLGALHATEARELLKSANIGRVDLASLHGQTIFHRPPVSWQLLNAHPIAHALRCEVVFDLRGADLACGGQGAPLTPLADWVLFRTSYPRAIVNLGGFANASLLPAEDHSPLSAQVAQVRGADLCACNQLLDFAARRVLGEAFDRNGATAATGEIHSKAFEQLLTRLAPANDGRSLGTGDELFEWVDHHAPHLSPADLLATASAAVGTTIGSCLRLTGVSEAVLAGGGAFHQPLTQAVARAAGFPTPVSDTLGVPVTAREALEWAVLGALAADRISIALPAVTHRPTEPNLPCGTWIRGNFHEESPIVNPS